MEIDAHKDDVAGLQALVQDAGDPLLQLAPLLAARDEQPHVQLQHALGAEEGRDVAPPVVLAPDYGDG